MALAEFEASSDRSNDRNGRNGTMAASKADLTSDDVACLTNVGGMLRRWRWSMSCMWCGLSVSLCWLRVANMSKVCQVSGVKWQLKKVQKYTEVRFLSGLNDSNDMD